MFPLLMKNFILLTVILVGPLPPQARSNGKLLAPVSGEITWPFIIGVPPVVRLYKKRFPAPRLVFAFLDDKLMRKAVVDVEAPAAKEA